MEAEFFEAARRKRKGLEREVIWELNKEREAKKVAKEEAEIALDKAKAAEEKAKQEADYVAKAVSKMEAEVLGSCDMDESADVEWLDDDYDDVTAVDGAAVVAAAMMCAVNAQENPAESALEFGEARTGQSVSVGSEYPLISEKLCRPVQQTCTNGQSHTSTLKTTEAVSEAAEQLQVIKFQSKLQSHL